MYRFRWKALASVALLGCVSSALVAQSVTTGAIGGMVTTSNGAPVEQAQVKVTNTANGFVSGGVTTAAGRFYVQGLDVGSGYRVTVRRIGFAPQQADNITVSLSQTTKVDFVMVAQATQVSAVTVTAISSLFESSNTGTKLTVSDSVIQRLPTANRNLTDFIKLVPQVSTSGPGYSAGGMSNRMNNVQIDGATERDVFGLGTTGQPGGQVSAKSISIDAVKEIQVLLAPFDVRQGNFGGLLLNAVTKSGTNELHGSIFGDFRNQYYGRNTAVLRATPFERQQYGFSIGGPVIKNKLQFFVNAERKVENAPLSGVYLGQPANATSPLQVATADLTRYEQIIAGAPYNHTAFGSAGYLNSPRPQSNFFGRLDLRLNDTHRMVLRYNYGRAEIANRAQNTRTSSAMVYSDNEHDLVDTKNAPVLQLFSNFSDGSSNELFVGFSGVKDRRVPNTIFPQITVTTPRVGGGNATIRGGADQFSMVNELDVNTYELTDNYSKNFGKHTFTMGTRNELVNLRNQFNQSSYGVWTFRTLDSLAAGNANSFRKAVILRDNGNVFFKALQSAFYAQDQWSPDARLTITAGLRADISTFITEIPYVTAIDSAYGRRTDDIPKRTLQWSPRVGFNWDINGDQRNQLRGGIGLFVGTPPYVWLENSYVNSGSIITFLNCNTSGSTDPAPAFNVDPSGFTTCRNGAGAKPIGESDFMQKGLKFPQPLRMTLGYDRRVGADWVVTLEGMYGRTLNQLFNVNLNLKNTPRGVDPHGRVLFGDSILVATGASRASIPAPIVANGGTSRFAAAFEMQNQSKDYFYNATIQVQKRYANDWAAGFAYTYGQTRDVASFTSSTAVSNWQFGRTLSGDQRLPYTAVSLFDQPHKFSTNFTYTAHWWKKQLATDFTMFYSGTSGSPHDYVYGAGSATGSGDLNADGVQGNDLLYVPKSALDPTEIQFAVSGTITAAQQAQAFENFINSSPCLKKFRGQILSRNACRVPWQDQTDLTIRQSLPRLFGGHNMSFQLEIYNVFNLINADWGKSKQTDGTTNSNVPILSHQGMTNVDPRIAVPIFTFNTTQRTYIKGNGASDNWQIQGGFRYSF